MISWVCTAAHTGGSGEPGKRGAESEVSRCTAGCRRTGVQGGQRGGSDTVTSRGSFTHRVCRLQSTAEHPGFRPKSELGVGSST